MARVAFVVFGSLSLAGALVLAACGKGASDSPPTPGSAAPTVPAPAALDRAKALIASGALVVDVREQGEWDEGHLAQARLIPVGSVGDRLAEIEQAAGGKDKPVVVYCKSGGRAGRAKQALEAAGFTNVVNAGGYRALSAAVEPAGAPAVTPPTP